MDANKKQAPSEQLRDDYRRVFVLGFLLDRTGEQPDAGGTAAPRWADGAAIFNAANEALDQWSMAFDDRREFRFWIVKLVDADLVTERHGRTMIEQRIEDLEFALSRWFQALLITGDLLREGQES